MSVIVNRRILSTSLTGVQRYLLELLARMKTDCHGIEPNRPLRGLGGHLWEQTHLAVNSPNSLLWSPSNSGPIFRAHQVLTIHDMVPIDHPEWVGRKYALWYGMLMPILARQVRHIVTVSEFSRKRIILTCGVPEEKVSVVYNGVDQRFFEGNQSTAFRNMLDIKFSRYVLALGSLEPRKNLNNLLEAWASIVDIYDGEVGLVVAGGKGAEQVFGQFNLKSRPEFVHFTGHVADDLLPALYANASAFCYTSRYEGFGLPLIEAMAAGVPCVGSCTSSIPEVVGEAGLLVNPLKPAEIAEAIRFLLDNPLEAAKYGAAGRSRARGFTWDVAAAQMDTILQRWQ